MSKKALNVQDDSRRKGIQGNTSKAEIKCVCLNARSIINKKTELNIMVDDIKPHIIGITESWANNDITNAELGLEGYVMFRKDRIGRRGGGVLLYIKDTIPAYEVQLQEEADCNDAIWCNLVTGHTTVIIGVVYRCPNITKQNNEKIHNAINEVSKGDCIIMGDFNHGNIKWDTLQSTELFVIIIDVITEEIEEGTPWAMLFADDLVLCDPDRQMMELRLERWRECMEKNGLKVSRAKTEHLQTIGDTDPVRMKRYMETEMVNLPTVQSFKYLGSTIDRRGGASKDVDNRVAKAWSKWRELSGVICDKKIPTKLKLLIYQTVIRPTLLYGCETWPMSVKDEKRMSTTEMRMVRWAMGVSLLEHRRNEEILEEAKVEAIATVMRRRRLEWFGHVKRRGETENIRAVAEMKMEGKRPRGRPKLRWNDTIRRDLKAWKIKEEWATDREKWKGLCKTRYPEQGDGGER